MCLSTSESGYTVTRSAWEGHRAIAKSIHVSADLKPLPLRAAHYPTLPKSLHRLLAKMEDNFTSIPVLDYSFVTSGQRSEFVKQLQHALIHVGFLYLSNPPVDWMSIESVVQYAPRLFDLPQEQKDAIQMINSLHFLGYSKLGSELTRGAIDQREQYDFATRHECQWKPGDPEYVKLWGDAQASSKSNSTYAPIPDALTL